MSIRLLARPTLVAILLGAGAVHAQTPPVVTDVGPPPAEERASTGAVVVEKKPAVRPRVGERSITRSQTKAQLARERAAEAAELRRRGAASLTGK